ncbi:MAG: type I methionyl aminopeptidase [Syntrophomonadaceae bacterium]|nr:type I methionyl aminopeptidase [Syntrophomonadaceae bacterium]MDD3889158.1 type I methionyl aminopeptidase [Syntrophomonadaceae bacterium]MDD4549289.1 type I methionyl aminopeptidase [Syntrophomonadaceae bacterium]
MIIIKTPAEIVRMRAAGELVARVLKILEARIKPGITTGELDAIAANECKKYGAIPVFKNYPHPRGGRPFPGVICASVNNEVVHGIPGARILHEGDIISIDFGVLLDGYAGDSAITVAVGQVDPEVAKLIKVTEAALLKGISNAYAGNKLGQISNAIQNYAEKHGYHVVREYVGHGIGKDMHEDPAVPNYGRPDRGPVLKEGMALAIEPMINIGTRKVNVTRDEWTVVTGDGSFSAHFEHSVAITANGPEILTLR